MFSVEALAFLEEEGTNILKSTEKMRKFVALAAECYSIPNLFVSPFLPPFSLLPVFLFSIIHSDEAGGQGWRGRKGKRRGSLERKEWRWDLIYRN
jgi:hypothetical protein